MYPLWVRVALLLLAIVLLLLCISQYQRINKQLRAQHAMQKATITTSELKPTKAQMTVLTQLKEIETELNVPWLELLSELEQLKAEHPEIMFNSIEPNREKRMLKVTAQVDEFGKVVNFITAMRTCPFFSDVSLVQHESKQRLKRSSDQATIEFAFMARWQANAQ